MCDPDTLGRALAGRIPVNDGCQKLGGDIREENNCNYDLYGSFLSRGSFGRAQ